MLRRGEGYAATAPAWLLAAPAADLGVHLHDLREALRCPGDEDAAVTRFAFGVYRAWLSQRLSVVGLPALRLDDGTNEWVLGNGEPATTLRGERFALFRALSGRRSADQIRRLDWDADPAPYLAVIAPYPLPPSPGSGS